MCGRARLSTDFAELRIRFAIPPEQPAPNLPARWNLAPMQDSVIVHLNEPGRRMFDVARWSLLPSWAKEPKLAYATFNAKAEGLAARPAFRDAFARRRCLVPFDSFYEWRTNGRDKQPYAVALASGEVMGVAGLWETWRSPEGETIRSFTVITTAARGVVAQLHHRMPAVLRPEAWPRWLGEEPATPGELAAVLAGSGGEDMRLWPVSRAVGNVRNDSPELIAPVPLPEQSGLLI